MVTVQHIVRQELSTHPFLLDLLHQELLNVSAVAEKLHPHVSSILGKEVKSSAIGMALRRVVHEFSQKSTFLWRFPKNTEITTRSNVYEVAIKKDPHTFAMFNHLQKKIKAHTNTFLSVVEGIHENVFLTNHMHKEVIKKMVGKRKIISERDNLGYISINFDPQTKEIPGIYYQITRTLAFNDISIQSFHTMGAEIIILFAKKDLMKAYETLLNLIENKPFF